VFFIVYNIGGAIKMRAIKLMLAALLVITITLPAAAASDKNFETEKKMGAEGAQAAAKELKFVTSPELTKRVEEIGKKLAEVAKTTEIPATYGDSTIADFDYSFKIVDDKQINAFSLPAGYIYINKGLIDAVQSDDELAGVLAHEIAHVTHHHLINLVQKQSRLDGTVFLVMAAAIIGKVQPQDMQNVFYGAQLLSIAKLNAYSRKAEEDADATAIQLMTKAGYNPVGLLTFMERMAHEEAMDPRQDNLGIASTHPPSRERAKSILSMLKNEGVPINRRAVSYGLLANVKETDKTAELLIGDRVLLKMADAEGVASVERAKQAAELINQAMAGDPQPYEVKIIGSTLIIRQKPVLEITAEDAALAQSTTEILAGRVKNSVQAAIASERMSRVY
jgi:Zn-dependent protease with chaperone function